MGDYALFGGCLRSDIEIAAARASAAHAVTWTISIVQQLAREDLHLLGEAVICAGIHIRLYRHRNGFRLTYTDSGSFDIVNGGGSILWLPGANHRIELVRLDIVNFVMATALHAGGTLSLHASGVVLGDAAIAFVGPKGCGKSTLAMALGSAGAAVVCDDMLALRAGPPPAALTGIQKLRLEPDVAACFGSRVQTDAAAFPNPPDPSAHTDSAVGEATPFAAFYILAPARDRRAPAHAVHRDRFGPAESIIALQTNAKIAHLLGVEGASSLLRPVTRLASQVPVYTLAFARELHALPDVVRQLHAWHAQEASATRLAGNLTVAGGGAGP